MKKRAGSGRLQGGQARIAWLLRANRLYGADEKLAVGVNFVKAFRGSSFRRNIDGAQLTRWERAGQRIGFTALRRYEELLNLPPHTLVAVADVLHRAESGVAGPSYLDRPMDGDAAEVRQRLEQLIDRARGSDPMTGHAWDDLTRLLCHLPDVFLYPSTLWNDLVDRLVAEMIIADGGGWIQRSEALHRLLGHPVGGPAVVASCAALAADPYNQVYVDPLTQLGTSSNRDAASKIIGQVVNPTNEQALRGAWYTAAVKLGRGHFTADELDILCRNAVDLLSATDGTYSGFRLVVAELLRQTDYEASRPLACAVRRITQIDRESRQVLHSGRAVPEELATAITSRATMAAMSMLPRDALEVDPMLIQLLDEMLFYPEPFKRFNATLLVRTTPYRVPVARALAQELTHRAVLENPAIAPPMVGAVALLGDDGTRRFLERLILAPGVPSYIPEAAVWMMGHAKGRSDDAFWHQAIRRHRDNLGTIRGITYALGLNRNRPLLRILHRDARLPAAARRAAAWWLNTPSRILDSTVKAEP